MKKILTLRNILLFILLFLAVAQLFKIDKTNPEVHSNQDFLSVVNPPENFSKMIKNECYDCHSNETKYPNYTNYAPISWWIKSNINGAREELNFSTWALYSEKQQIAKLQACYEMMEEGEMPVSLYVMMHEEAEFSDEENEALKNWFKNQ